ncbi:alpha-amylase family glycosyl hydrolase [Oleidesulfovibrio sp.]|uniref:alpha-amylase family glycosyl hydrolase n=1 Tax=Oleidesulfovibrio sp. TaxID=2909707 RepID=UPI003A83C755
MENVFIPAHGPRHLSNNSWFFRLWSPRRKPATLVIEQPREQEIPLQYTSHGWREAIVSDLPAGTLYRFRLGKDLLPDPASAHQPRGIDGPSMLDDPAAFTWTDESFGAVSMKNAVIYEIHTGTFTPEGSLDAAAQRLPDIADLGVTAVELMPLVESTGRWNWGYDGVFPYSVHHRLGGPDALRRFVDTAHACGLAVYGDVVLNHLGPEGNYLPRFGPYLSSSHHSPWGACPNFDGPNSGPVRRFFLDCCLRLLAHFHMDGLRLDATPYIIDKSAEHILATLSRETAILSRTTGRRLHIIAESTRNEIHLVTPQSDGGFGLDSQWSDDFHHAVHALTTGERHGFYADFHPVKDREQATDLQNVVTPATATSENSTTNPDDGTDHDSRIFTIDALETIFTQGWFRQGQILPWQNGPYGSKPDNLKPEHIIAYLQNHDTIGNRPLGERMHMLTCDASRRMITAALLLSPFVPLLFMGEEYNDPAPFHFFIDHSDSLNSAVAKGRAREAKEFGWPDKGITPPAPHAQTSFARSRLSWDLRHTGRHGIIHSLYRRCIRLRQTLPSLDSPSFDRLTTQRPHPTVLSIGRTDPEHMYSSWLLLNCSNEKVSFPIDAAITPLARQQSWTHALCTADRRWQDPDVPEKTATLPARFVAGTYVPVTLPSWCALLIS